MLHFLQIEGKTPTSKQTAPECYPGLTAVARTGAPPPRSAFPALPSQVLGRTVWEPGVSLQGIKKIFYFHNHNLFNNVVGIVAVCCPIFIFGSLRGSNLVITHNCENNLAIRESHWDKSDSFFPFSKLKKKS